MLHEMGGAWEASAVHGSRAGASNLEIRYVDPKTGEEKTREEEIGGLEITYVDPKTLGINQKRVFCNAEDWKDPFQARLLVSVDLVNSLSEALETRQRRFSDLHSQLERNRSVFFYKLWRLRRLVEKLPGKILNSQEGGVSLATPRNVQPVEHESEICLVNFYLPKFYLDPWTHEHLFQATRNFTMAMNLEIKSTIEKINIVGCGTWRQLIAYFLREGHSATKIAQAVMHCCKHDEETRYIQNRITNGLRDDFDRMQELVIGLCPEHIDCNNRAVAVKDLCWRQVSKIPEMIETLHILVDRLGRPSEQLSGEELARLHGRATEMLDRKTREARELAGRTLEMVKDWEARSAEFPLKELEKLRLEATRVNQRTRLIQIKYQHIESRAEETGERKLGLEQSVAEEQQLLEDFHEKLNHVPMPSDDAVRYRRLLREYKSLKKEEAAIKEAMSKPCNRLKAFRTQLRILYKKLEWGVDLSESDDGDGKEAKPYWQRRKLAKEGGLPFDMGHFLTAEKEFKDQRMKRLALKQQEVDEAKLHDTLMARQTAIKTAQAEICRKKVEHVMLDLFHKPTSAKLGDGSETKQNTGWNLLKQKKELLKIIETKEQGDQNIAEQTPAPKEGGTGAPGWAELQQKRALLKTWGGQDVIEPMQALQETAQPCSIEGPSHPLELASTPYGIDPVTNAIAVVRRRLAAHLEVTEGRSLSHVSEKDFIEMDAAVPGKPPWWTHCPEELEWRCTHLIRLQQLRDSFDAQLLDCVRSFVDLLPHDGHMGGLRSRLLDMIDMLHTIPTNPCIWQEEEVDRQLEAIGSAMQCMVEEGIAYGEQVVPIRAAMRHSVAIAELRRRLGEVRQGEYRLRSELRAVAELEKVLKRHTCGRSTPACALGPTVHSRRLSPLTQKCSPRTDPVAGAEVGGQRPLRASPNLIAASKPLMASHGARSKAKVTASAQRAEGVDFGFRPDGACEDSLENWSLFKVSKGKGHFIASASQHSTTCDGSSSCSRRQRFRLTVSRAGQNPIKCDFHKFMSATATAASETGSEPDTWRSMSMPNLAPWEKKHCPKLPELVGSRNCSRQARRRCGTATGVFGQFVAARKPDSRGGNERASRHGKLRATAPLGTRF